MFWNLEHICYNFSKKFFLKFHSRFWDNFWPIERPSKMMKKVFYFMIKALFILETFTFLPLLFGYVGKRLDKKVIINFRNYGATEWKQIITIQILPFISRSNGNQTTNFGNLTKHSLWNIFLQNHAKKR